MNKFIKHIEHQKVVALKDFIAIQEDKIGKQSLSKSDHVSITLFAFAKDKEIPTHVSSGDAMVTILQGSACICIDGVQYDLETNETIVIPANLAHSVYAKEAFKMMLTVIFENAIGEN